MRSAALFVLVLGGCRVAPTSTSDPQPQPEPVVDESEPSNSPIAFGYVTVGGERSTGLPQMIDKGGLAWVADAISGESLTPELVEAMAEVGLGLDDETMSSEAIDPSVLTRAGFGPPSPTIWLLDDQGVCEARITTPYVGMYFEVGPTVEVSWRLEGCDPLREWGPIGLFTVAPPEGMRWLEGVVTFSEAVEPSNVEGRVGPLVREFAETMEDPPDEVWLREHSVGDTEIAQIVLAGVWRHHPGPGEAYDDCAETAEVVRQTGQWRESGFEAIELGLDDSPWLADAELIGAFVIEGEPVSLVFSARLQALVITPGEEPRTITTGIHHDEVVASSGWSPTAGCEP